MYNYQELVGIPFVDGGRNPKTGFDCWGLARYIYHMRGIDLPEYPIDPRDHQAVHANIVTASADWDSVGHPEEGDLVLLQLYEGVANHVGIYIGNGDFIHAYGTSVVIDRLRRWRSRVVGFYRPKGAEICLHSS
ncbi:C40 family peptidase [Megasphaera hexanoica]|uniref:C40 family peptidase n=1 Tax=Megasphaera hexanoica TaxID=1675036 RepID=A0ABW7DJW3_9FIRM|nr:C40 family peptidase [Megasphaera hexanoica]AXB82342.1 hypothetical protein ACT01_08880 [Megasphaera hexanoica]